MESHPFSQKIQINFKKSLFEGHWSVLITTELYWLLQNVGMYQYNPIESQGVDVIPVIVKRDLKTDYSETQESK